MSGGGCVCQKPVSNSECLPFLVGEARVGRCEIRIDDDPDSLRLISVCVK